MLSTVSVYCNLLIQNKISHICDSVYVSMLPVEHTTFTLDFLTNSHVQLIDFVNKTTPERPLGCVISVIHPSELESRVGLIPTTHEQWESAGIKHILIPMVDQQGKVDEKSAVDVLKIAEQIHTEGKSVLFHCLAGKSRSAMMALVFIVCNCFNKDSAYTKEEALNLLVSRRKEILLATDKDKLETAQQLIFAVNSSELQVMNELIDDLDTTDPRLHELITDVLALERKENPGEL